MSSSKIQPVLVEELARLRAEGHRRERVSVVISIVTADATPARDAADLEAIVTRAQVAVTARLADLGIRDYTRLVLANAIEVGLTPDQIETIAAEPSVKAIVWNRLERVTTR